MERRTPSGSVLNVDMYNRRGGNLLLDDVQKLLHSSARNLQKYLLHTDHHPIKFCDIYQSWRSAATLSGPRLYILCGTIRPFVLARLISSAGCFASFTLFV